ncbi:unnamed protein product [Rotaria sordida]|uniref:EGF-like domain-containing protein n=1 Tax=Rotaria sordida TaxID=392033 RepID=A0A815QXD5_9BILA|nr:unnamed protein product [Rotaria sordida]
MIKGSLFFDTNHTTVTLTVLRDNCSVYNPCGRNGRCYNNLDGEWMCVCKFWWNGTLCNDMSSSGKQVITVGVMLFVLIVIFYGLQLIYHIRTKRKYPSIKTEKLNTHNVHRKFSTVSTVEPESSRHILSFIIVIGTLILATATLIIKWTILQLIHNDIINKFKKNESLFFQRHSICKVMDVRQEFNVITLPAACLLIVIFSLTTKRVSFQRGKIFKGYIGIPIPLDFFVHVRRTFSAVIFAVYADDLLEIATGIFTRQGSSTNEGIIVTYLREILKVLVIGFRRYPTLAAIHIDTPFSLICASLYTWLDFSITIVDTGFCRNDFYSTDKNYNIESCYVKNLLEMNNTNKSTNCFAKTFGFIYTWRDDFRFSSRVISVYAAISLLLFFITVQALVRIPPRLVELRSHIQTGVDVLVAIYLRIDPNLQTDKDQSSNFRLPNFDRPRI